MRPISNVDIDSQKDQKGTNQSGNKKNQNKNHISNKEWNALSTDERNRIRKARGQTIQSHPNINKRNVSNIDTAEEGEVEDPPPNAGTNLGNRHISRRRRKRFDMSVVVIQHIV